MKVWRKIYRKILSCCLSICFSNQAWKAGTGQEFLCPHKLFPCAGYDSTTVLFKALETNQEQTVPHCLPCRLRMNHVHSRKRVRQEQITLMGGRQVTLHAVLKRYAPVSAGNNKWLPGNKCKVWIQKFDQIKTDGLGVLGLLGIGRCCRLI